MYVISMCEWRDGSSVCGVAASLDEAFAAAARIAEEQEPGRTWMHGWKAHDLVASNGAEESTRWMRDALTADGEIHPSLYQEIVRVPLVVG